MDLPLLHQALFFLLSRYFKSWSNYIWQAPTGSCGRKVRMRLIFIQHIRFLAIFLLIWAPQTKTPPIGVDTPIHTMAISAFTNELKKLNKKRELHVFFSTTFILVVINIIYIEYDSLYCLSTRCHTNTSMVETVSYEILAWKRQSGISGKILRWIKFLSIPSKNVRQISVGLNFFQQK